MPVKGLSQAMTFTDAVVATVAIKAERAVTSGLAVGAAFAAMLTPVDTSFLINSQIRRVTRSGDVITGTLMYTAHYAAAVNSASGKLKGKPRAHFGKTREGVEFGGGTGKGKYWDPKAEPGFITKGFQNNLEKIDRAMRKAFEL